MPARNVKFNKDWLKDKDDNGHLLKDWCETGDSDFNVNCIVCRKTIDIRNRGKNQLIAHAGTKKHRINAAGQLQRNQTKLFIVAKNDGENVVCIDRTTGANSLWKMSFDDEVTRAEILWTLKSVASGISYSSCDKLKNVFMAMFPDSSIAKSFTLGADKMSYEVAYGLGPFFHEEFINDLKTSKAMYTLSFDEATNACGEKQLDLHLRWWKNQCGIQNYYMRTCLLGHATAEIMKKMILESLKEDDLSIEKLLMLSSDGPNVNKKLHRLMNEHLKSSIRGHQGLIELGSCNLHIVHNSFRHGLEKVNKWGVEEFLDAVFKYFHKYPARKEDFCGVQELLDVEQKQFKRYVNSRWLSLVPVVGRVIQQYSALSHYFTHVVPKLKNVKTDTYYAKIIYSALKNSSTLMRLHFLKSLGGVYTKFLTLFQSDEPLIHILYDELIELLKSLMIRFVKRDIVEGKHGHKLSTIDLSETENLLPLNEIKLGEETKKVMGEPMLKSTDINIFQLDARHVMVSVVQYLIGRVPIDSSLLRNLQCLHPLMRTAVHSEQYIRAVAKELPRILPISEHDSLQSEWHTYANENIPSELYIDEEYESPEGHSIKWKRVDIYWENILSRVSSLGTPKYPTLSKVVKAALTLSHGQAHVERGFSINNSLVTTDRSSLKESSINGLRTIQDKVRNEGGATKVSISAKTIRAFRSAHSKYKAMRDEEKRITEEKCKENEKGREEQKRMEHKRKLEVKEAELYKKQKLHHTDIDISKKLVSEANERLKKACTSTKINTDDIMSAQALLESGTDKLQKSSLELKKVAREIETFKRRM